MSLYHVFLEVDALTHALIPSTNVMLLSVQGTNMKYPDDQRLNKPIARIICMYLKEAEYIRDEILTKILVSKETYVANV